MNIKRIEEEMVILLLSRIENRGLWMGGQQYEMEKNYIARYDICDILYYKKWDEQNI